MATWTTIPQANIEPEKPIRAADIWAIYQDILALAEGASGAPKIADKVIPVVASGNTNVLFAKNLSTVYSNNYTKVFDFRMFRKGIIRVKTELSVNIVSPASPTFSMKWVRVTSSEEPVLVERTFTSNATYSDDITLAGTIDHIRLYLKCSTNLSPLNVTPTSIIVSVDSTDLGYGAVAVPIYY
ncbi:MAG: hypothetical protein LBI78_07360 [Campylobacteraceae bacterium]|jgi:hypothetical protein|nr:hypothetical protein [Campylobacteraceae bacterium]